MGVLFQPLDHSSCRGVTKLKHGSCEHFHVLLWRWNLVALFPFFCFLLKACVQCCPLLRCQITAPLDSNMATILWGLLLVCDLVTKYHTYYPQPSSTSVDTEPPVIDRCRSPPTVQAKDVETAVVWEVPQFSDNSGMSGSCSPGVLFCCCSVFRRAPPPSCTTDE